MKQMKKKRIDNYNGIDDNYVDTFPVEFRVFPDESGSPKIPERRNCDSFVDSHGRKIIQLCPTYNLTILNGRSKGDFVGNFTHLNFNGGSSTIDYSLCNNTLYNNVENFLVLPLNELSDHSKIVTAFKSESEVTECAPDMYTWRVLKNNFRWDNTKASGFRNVFENFRNEIDDISQRIEAGLVKSTGVKIQDIFVKAAEIVLQKKTI